MWMDLAGAFVRLAVNRLSVLKGFSVFKKRSVCVSVSSDIYKTKCGMFQRCNLGTATV